MHTVKQKSTARDNKRREINKQSAQKWIAVRNRCKSETLGKRKCRYLSSLLSVTSCSGTSNRVVEAYGSLPTIQLLLFIHGKASRPTKMNAQLRLSLQRWRLVHTSLWILDSTTKHPQIHRVSKRDREAHERNITTGQSILNSPFDQAIVGVLTQ